MKSPHRLFLLIFIFLLISDLSFSDQPAKPHTVDGIYNHFSTLSVKTFFKHMQKAAIWLSKNPETGLAEMNKPFTRWNYMDAMSPYFCVLDCNDRKVVAHPNPNTQRLINRQDIFEINKDKYGKLWIIEGCEKSASHPKGYWLSQCSTFLRSITGLIDNFYIQTIFIQVPDSKLQLVGFFPVKAASKEESEKKSQELNGLVNEWSIDQFNEIFK